MVPPPCFAANGARVVPLNRCSFAAPVATGTPAWQWPAPGRTAPVVAAAFIYGATRRRWRRVRAVQTREPVAQEEVAEMLGKGNFTGPSCPLSRRLKDVVFVKEMRDAITSGEFALKLAGSRGLAAMNYQSLCNRLHVIAMRLEDESVDLEILPPLEAQKCLKTVNQISEELESRILKGTPAAAPESSETGEKVSKGMPDPRRLLLYIREDQTVDLDGALNEARKVAKFSGDLWERLNGQGHGRRGRASEAFGESEAAKRKRKAMEMARQDFEEAEEQRKELNPLWRNQDFVAEAAGELNQAPDEARTQDYLWQLRSQWRQCEQRCRSCRSLLLLRSIEWSLQCSAEELEKDLQQTSMSDWAVTGQQQKLQVAELALMEKQAASYQEQAAEHLEELEVLESDCARFASRLGLKSEEESGDLNSSLRRLLSQVKRGWERTKSGLEFYTSGLQLLWQDIQYACNLVSKAAFSNYTLRAWEVRTLQRTVKDLLTLIPFLIILIIPLSPVGHVLVFSFFQKNFPEFFPSSFTEQRQNVTKIHRDIVPEDGDDSGR